MDGSEIEIECSVVVESKVITLPVVLEAKQTEETVIQPQEESETLTESTTEPVKRFYASKRGRKHRERDKADLVSIWKQNESAEYLIQTLGTYQMIERRCY